MDKPKKSLPMALACHWNNSLPSPSCPSFQPKPWACLTWRADFFCPQHSFSKFELGSRPQWVKNKTRWNRIKPPTKTSFAVVCKTFSFWQEKMITIMDFMFLSIPYSFQFKGNIPEPFKAVAVTATHNKPVNGLKLLYVTVQEPNKTIMKIHRKLPLQRRIKY